MGTYNVLHAFVAEEQLGLMFKKLVKPKLADFLEVPNEADAVRCPVPCVYLQESPAGKIWTFVAKCHFPAGEKLTLSFEIRAFLLSDPATGAVLNLPPFLGDTVRVRKIGAADSAVHAAGRDLVRCKYARLHQWFVMIKKCFMISGG